MNDSTLTTELADGPAVSFTEDDRGFVYAVVRRIVRDEDAADDVTQDALLAAYRHRHTFRGQSRYRTWLYRVAVTSALSHLRRRRQRRAEATRSLDVAGADRDLATAAPSPERVVASAQTAGIVRRHLDQLDPRYASVLRLRLDEDLGEADVARTLGLSVATVKIRGHRARLALRSTLAAAL
ncbi:MAG: sigma-70 family RNA polymerase sigma factor [Myxococcales bacterium]|nr:sigma-70 family RNA polymerase sigma factor [Myxococcales bacterium]